MHFTFTSIIEFTGFIIVIDLILIFVISALCKILSDPRYVVSIVTYFAHCCVFFESRRTWFDILCFSYELTLRLLMSYIYGAPILDVSRSYTTTQHSR